MFSSKMQMTREKGIQDDDRESKQQSTSSFLTSPSFPRSNSPRFKDQTRILSQGTEERESIDQIMIMIEVRSSNLEDMEPI